MKTATHGLAPDATLHVYTSPSIPPVSDTQSVYTDDVIRLARGEAMTRDIVVISNHMHLQTTLERAVPATPFFVNHVALGAGYVPPSLERVRGFYKGIYGALIENVVDKATTAQERALKHNQDIYIFAGWDRSVTGVGALAGLPGAVVDGNGRFLSKSIIKPYSIVGVGVDGFSGRCLAFSFSYCLATPTTFYYRERREHNGSYKTSLTLSSTRGTNNAAAALIAGGIALLQDVFGDQLSSERLVARLLATASRSYDIDGDGDNDYNTLYHGQGLMDLECATRPITSLTNTRCRPYPSSQQGGGQSAPPSPPSSLASPSLSSCGVEGLRLILQGDVCSSAYIDMTPLMAGRGMGMLYLGAGFGDSLSAVEHGLTLYDAFDTPWTAQNRYTPYALSMKALTYRQKEGWTTDDRLNWIDRQMGVYDTATGHRRPHRRSHVFWRNQRTSMVAEARVHHVATRPHAYGVYGTGSLLNRHAAQLGWRARLAVSMPTRRQQTLSLGIANDMPVTSLLFSHHEQDHEDDGAYGAYHALPYGDMVGDDVMAVSLHHRYGESTDHAVGVMVATDEAKGTRYGAGALRTRGTRLGVAEYAVRGDDMVYGGLMVGVIDESSRFLSGYGTGIFSFGRSRTRFFGVRGAKTLGSGAGRTQWRAFFNAYGGRTSMKTPQPTSVISMMEAYTSSMVLGLTGRHVFHKADRLSLWMRQPLKVERSVIDMRYKTPYGDSHRFDGAPSGRTLDMGIHYGMALAAGTYAHMALDYRHEPYHSKGEEDAFFAFLSLKRVF
ncbi:MAG: hypothetical protein GDA54_00735 [Alphaproteobacteria bacterium GM7ARS4]|nr:hypothetical protein [Alphaproteobacteria bacterium GM7ARS4]